MAVDTLGEAGFEVIEAVSADQAATILQVRSDVRVVFTDVVTPGDLNGLDLADMARTLHPQIIVIAVAGALPAGFSGAAPGVHLIAKPYRMTEVIRWIHKHTADQSRSD